MSDRELESVVATEGDTARADGAREIKREASRENGKKEEHTIPDVRASDIEPYTGLRYLSKLFKLMAVVLILLLVAEAITGLSTQGSMAIPTLLGEASRLLVLAGLLWGTGDVAHLLIDVGHDVRAGRILLSRQVYHTVGPKAVPRSLTREGSTAGMTSPASTTTTTVTSTSSADTGRTQAPDTLL